VSRSLAHRPNSPDAESCVKGSAVFSAVFMAAPGPVHSRLHVRCIGGIRSRCPRQHGEHRGACGARRRWLLNNKWLLNQQSTCSSELTAELRGLKTGPCISGKAPFENASRHEWCAGKAHGQAIAQNGLGTTNDARGAQSHFQGERCVQTVGLPKPPCLESGSMGAQQPAAAQSGLRSNEGGIVSTTTCHQRDRIIQLPETIQFIATSSQFLFSVT
jgi:hypothetical protein